MMTTVCTFCTMILLLFVLNGSVRSDWAQLRSVMCGSEDGGDGFPIPACATSCTECINVGYSVGWCQNAQVEVIDYIGNQYVTNVSETTSICWPAHPFGILSKTGKFEYVEGRMLTYTIECHDELGSAQWGQCDFGGWVSYVIFITFAVIVIVIFILSLLTCYFVCYRGRHCCPCSCEKKVKRKFSDSARPLNERQSNINLLESDVQPRKNTNPIVRIMPEQLEKSQMSQKSQKPQLPPIKCKTCNGMNDANRSNCILCGKPLPLVIYDPEPQPIDRTSKRACSDPSNANTVKRTPSTSNILRTQSGPAHNSRIRSGRVSFRDSLRLRSSQAGSDFPSGLDDIEMNEIETIELIGVVPLPEVGTPNFHPQFAEITELEEPVSIQSSEDPIDAKLRALDAIEVELMAASTGEENVTRKGSSSSSLVSTRSHQEDDHSSSKRPSHSLTAQESSGTDADIYHRGSDSFIIDQNDSSISYQTRKHKGKSRKADECGSDSDSEEHTTKQKKKHK